MKKTLRFSGHLFKAKLLLSFVLVITIVTSSMPMVYAESNTVNALKNPSFDEGDISDWHKASGEITLKDGEGAEGTNALELTDGEDAVYQAVTKDDGTEFIQGSTFQWELKYKSTKADDIVALVLGLNEPTGADGQSDQLRQMVDWMKKKKIDKKVPADGQYTVIVYSKPFKADGTFDDGKFGVGRPNFSLVPTMYCTEKLSVSLFRTASTDWTTVSNPATTPYTLNKNSSSIYYSLISYKGSPLTDDVSFLVEKTGSEVTEYSNLQNGGFEKPQISDYTDSFYYQANHNDVPSWFTTSTDNKIELFNDNNNRNSAHFIYGEKAVFEGNQSAELNAEQASTLYQYIKTEAGSQYKWSLSHRGRYGADIMALIIGPKQDKAPGKKGNRLDSDQFMQMVDWVKNNKDYYPDVKDKIAEIEAAQSNNERKANDYRCEPVRVTVYSKPFAEKGGFVSDNATYFSSTESTVFSERWDITIICSGDSSWQTYGENEEDLYSIYNVPEGQTDSIFAFTAYKGTNEKEDSYYINNNNTAKMNTYGNLLDGVNFDLYYPASSVSFTGGDAVLTYVYKNQLETSELKSGEPAQSIMVDENSTFTLDVTPRYSTTTDENGNEVPRVDADGNKIQNTFLGAYITIGGKRQYYPATAVGTDNAVYFSETEDENGMKTYSYGQSNVSGRVIVELVYSEVYTMTYNANGGEAYSVHNGSYTGDMDWRGSNSNIARFYEKASGTYTSTACQWWEDNKSVVFKGWELVGGSITDLSDNTPVPEDEKVLFAKDVKVSYTVPTLTDEEKEGLTPNEQEELFLKKARDVDFIISDGKYEGRINAYNGGVFVANWEYKTSVVAQTEQLDGSFADSGIGGQVSLTNHTMDITDDSGKVYGTGESIDYTDKFTFTSEFYNVVNASSKENTGYKFLGWYDDEGNKLSSTTDHSYTIEPYFSTSDKNIETQTPAVIYARYGLACKVKFHINDKDTVSTVTNPDADLYRVYYPTSVDISQTARLNTDYEIKHLESNNHIKSFYDIPTPISTNGKIFKGWYADKDNDVDINPIQWDNKAYTEDTDIYAHWIDVGTVSQDESDKKILDKSTVSSGLLPGIDLLGVQIRYEEKDDNYPNGRGTGTGQSPHFDTDGLRFITCIKEDILSQTSSLFKKTYGTYTPQSLSYGYVIAKEATADKYLNKDYSKCLEYKDTNVNGVDTTTDYKFVSNVDCTSSVGGYNKNTDILDHRNFSDYRIYSMVISYNTAGKTDAQIESAKKQNIIARPYLRYQDANGLYRTYYQDYTGTKVYGGCSTNYETTRTYLSDKGYFPTV